MTGKEMIYPKGWDSFRRLTFAPAARRAGLIFLSGSTAVDRNTGDFVGEGDIVTQTRQIYKNMQEILEAAGASMADVVQTTDYITTTAGYKETANIRREFFGDSFPASTGIIISGLLNPKALIEIDAIAVVSD
jgi:enamine deaminase RidA (YjgF/YER057c/UK114 family)